MQRVNLKNILASTLDFGTYFIDKQLTHRVGGNQKRYLKTDKRGSKIDRNSVFDCHLSPVSNDFYLRSSIVLKFRMPPTWCVEGSDETGDHDLCSLTRSLASPRHKRRLIPKFTRIR